MTITATITAFTGIGVEQVTPLNKQKLDELATWLCQNAEHCEHEFETYRSRFSSDYAERKWSKEQEANGGYCHSCRDFAGKLLAESPIAEWGEVSHE